MKYIFMTGVPGSKWSSVAKSIYYSASIDRTDWSEERTYYHDVIQEKVEPTFVDSGGEPDFEPNLMHMGAYFDPGMEFGDWFETLSAHTREECEAEFDRPFTGSGTRIIKSHVFAHHIDFIKATWPDCPLILVHRDNDAALGWWVVCGHFDITYPRYPYYKNLAQMNRHIAQQNHSILKAWRQYPGRVIGNSEQLASYLGLAQPSGEVIDFVRNDTRIKVI
jgi:hypothetical protein